MSCSKTLDSYSESSELIHESYLCVWIFSPEIKHSLLLKVKFWECDHY